MLLNVLLVEDNPGDARLFREMLAEVPNAPFRLETADRLSTALARLAAGDICAILLDLGLPDCQGFDTFVRMYEQAPSVPILVLTGLDDDALAVKAVREGAQDYLVKGRLEGQWLVRAIRYSIERKRVEEEIRQLNRDLERRVKERTAELERANLFLRTVVSERKRAEEDLSRYFTVSLDLMCIAGFDGYFKRLNPAWEKTLGFTQVELLARPCLDFVHPEDRAATQAEAEKVHAGKTVISFENRYRCKDGSYRRLLWKAVPVTDQQLVYAAARDITERKQAEEALAESERRTRLVIDRAYDAFVAMDAGGLITEWNPQAEAVFGWSRSEVMGRLLADTIIPLRFREAHHKGLKHFLATGEGPVLNKQIEMAALHRDGHEFPVELSISCLRLGDSYIFSAFLRDITERKRAQAALRESEERHRRLFENSPQPMWVFDRETLAFLAVNDAALRHYGYSREEFLAMTIRDIRPAEDIPALLQHLSGSLAEPSDVSTWRHRKKDGTLIDVEVYSQRLRFGGREASLVLVYDVTERKEAQARLQRLNAELEAANKELETFTYSVSHDLRAPLRHVSGFSRILLEDHAPQLTPDAQHCVARVQQGVEQMGLLVDDLLNLSRISRQELRRQITGLTPLVEQMVQQLSAETKGRPVDWRLQPLPFADCDPGLIKQVFANLLSNAVKFTRTRSPAIIEVGAQTRNGEPVLFVRDNAVGFPMKYAGKLFGVFQRLHHQEDFEGTGVGLAIVHRIVTKHGGRIWAESELDKGATFFFTLGAPESLESSAEVNPECTPVK